MMMLHDANCIRHVFAKTSSACSYTQCILLHAPHAYSALPSAFFFAFLFSRNGFVRSSRSSGSSSDFSDLTSSGLYQTGGWVINAGPAGSNAIVKWNPATKVF